MKRERPLRALPPPRRPPQSRERGGTGFGAMVLVAGLLAAVGVFHVGGRVMVVQRGYALSSKARENRELVQERELLRLEVASLRLPSRVETYAREKLGMAPPAADKIVVVAARRATPTKERAAGRERSVGELAQAARRP